MKVYIPIFFKDPHKDKNPYVSVITDAIQKSHTEVTFEFGYEIFWTDHLFDFDIVHVMWPDIFLVPNIISKVQNLESRLRDYRKRGGKIVATCHNLRPHVNWDKGSDSIYDIVYGQCDCVFHMGEYSRKELSAIYPNTRHEILEHPIYDSIYRDCPTCTESIERLHLDKKRRYILCMGAFRNDDERNLVVNIAKYLHNTEYTVLAPNFLPDKKWMIKHPSVFVHWLNAIIGLKALKINWIHSFVPDELLPFYYGASDIAFIHRLKILNSGNLPLALYMKKVVVGPNVGNVGSLLMQTGNPVFDPKDFDSVKASIEQGVSIVERGTADYDVSNWRSSFIAEKQYKYYKTLM